MSSTSYYPSFLPSILSPVFLSFLNEWFSPNEDCRHRRHAAPLALPFNEDLSFEKNGWRRQRQRQRRWRGRARSRQTDGKSNFQDSATQRTEEREGEGDIASHDKSFVAQRHLQLCAPHWMEEEGGGEAGTGRDESRGRRRPDITSRILGNPFLGRSLCLNLHGTNKAQDDCGGECDVKCDRVLPGLAIDCQQEMGIGCIELCGPFSQLFHFLWSSYGRTGYNKIGETCLFVTIKYVVSFLRSLGSVRKYVLATARPCFAVEWKGMDATGMRWLYGARA